jgi:hypothetical protein
MADHGCYFLHMNKTLCSGNIEVKRIAGKHQASAISCEAAGRRCCSAVYCRSSAADHERRTQGCTKENLIPIKALPSQKRKYAQNNVVF